METLKNSNIGNYSGKLISNPSEILSDLEQDNIRPVSKRLYFDNIGIYMKIKCIISNQEAKIYVEKFKSYKWDLGKNPITKKESFTWLIILSSSLLVWVIILFTIFLKYA